MPESLRRTASTSTRSACVPDLYPPHISPLAAQIGFELLPFLNPGRILPLGYFHRRMAEKNRNTLEWHARLEELDTEGVAESVCIRESHDLCLYRPNRTLPNPPLPVLDRSLELAITAPEEEFVGETRSRCRCIHNNALRLIAGN